MKRLVVVLSLTGVLACVAFADDKDAAGKKAGTETPKRVVKSNAEWAKILPRESFFVTRMKATEPPGTGKYASYHGKGIFACICCGTELFDAKTKFESGTGWPSFNRPIDPQRIATEQDFSDPGEVRTEVMCAVCDAHLGHVFNDGPAPTGLRFCINSASLKLIAPPGQVKTKAAAKGKTVKGASKAKDGGVKAKAKSD